MFGFFFYQFCNPADLPEVSNFFVSCTTIWIGHCCCVHDLLGQRSLSLTSACSASALFCSPRHPRPRAPWYCLCLSVLPIPVCDLPWRKWGHDAGGATACTVGSRHLSSGLVFSSRRMKRMRILPLEYLTVTFSCKMATSEQRHDLSCQFVSTQFMLSLDPRTLLCRQCPQWAPARGAGLFCSLHP